MDWIFRIPIVVTTAFLAMLPRLEAEEGIEATNRLALALTPNDPRSIARRAELEAVAGVIATPRPPAEQAPPAAAPHGLQPLRRRAPDPSPLAQLGVPIIRVKRKRKEA